MIKRVVVPVDFSEASIRGARYAVDELAPQLGAEVIFVTVLELTDLRVAMSAGLHGFENDEELHRQVETWIEDQFRKIESASQTSVRAKRDIRRSGLPEREIVEAIREHQADLIVMGSVGVAKRIPFGSKAEYVIRHIDVPVVLLRPKSD